MVLFLSKLISSALQIVLFAIIPFLWWLVTARKKVKFTKWIGLKSVSGNKSKCAVATVMLALAFIFSGILTLYLIKDVKTAISEFSGLGVYAIPAVIVYAALNTALPEELLFRGFFLKRLKDKFGFIFANCFQSMLFGLLHGVLLFASAGPDKAVIIIILTGFNAWFMGYINEKYAEGSILPSIIIHAVSNLFSGICAAFSLI